MKVQLDRNTHVLRVGDNVTVNLDVMDIVIQLEITVEHIGKNRVTLKVDDPDVGVRSGRVQ